MPYVKSEQDFQSNALTTLKEAVLHDPPKPLKKSDIKGIWRYHFKTQFNPNKHWAAVFVEFFIEGGESMEGGGKSKRSIGGREVEESIIRVIHAFHSNGTFEERHEPVFRDEVGYPARCD